MGFSFAEMGFSFAASKIVLMWLFHQFQRKPAIYAVGATAAMIAASVVIAYAKVRGYQ